MKAAPVRGQRGLQPVPTKEYVPPASWQQKLAASKTLRVYVEAPHSLMWEPMPADAQHFHGAQRKLSKNFTSWLTAAVGNSLGQVLARTNRPIHGVNFGLWRKARSALGLELLLTCNDEDATAILAHASLRPDWCILMVHPIIGDAQLMRVSTTDAVQLPHVLRLLDVPYGATAAAVKAMVAATLPQACIKSARPVQFVTTPALSINSTAWDVVVMSSSKPDVYNISFKPDQGAPCCIKVFPQPPMRITTPCQVHAPPTAMPQPGVGGPTPGGYAAALRHGAAHQPRAQPMSHARAPPSHMQSAGPSHVPSAAMHAEGGGPPVGQAAAAAAVANPSADGARDVLNVAAAAPVTHASSGGLASTNAVPAALDGDRPALCNAVVVADITATNPLFDDGVAARTSTLMLEAGPSRPPAPISGVEGAPPQGRTTGKHRAAASPGSAGHMPEDAVQPGSASRHPAKKQALCLDATGALIEEVSFVACGPDMEGVDTAMS